jgi:glutathione S-transferase
MMKLYFTPKTRSTRPRWMLEELGLPYELVSVDLAKGEHKRPEYLRIHPMGSVPALEDDGQPIFESAAILQHLADKHPDKGLAPALGTPARAEYYQWMMFCMATLEPVLAAVGEHTHFLPEAQRVPSEAERGRKRFWDLARMLEEKLRGREFLVGAHFTAADLLLASILGWARGSGLLADFPGLQAYAQRHLARPAAQRAMK